MTATAAIIGMAGALLLAVLGWLQAHLSAKRSSELAQSAAALANRLAERGVDAARERARAGQAATDTAATTEVEHAVADHSLSEHLRGLNAAASPAPMADEVTKPGGGVVR